MNDALVISSDLLYEWSGQQFNNLCREVVRPCQTNPRCSCGPFGAGVPFANGFSTGPSTSHTYLFDDGARNCGCKQLHEIGLGATPVTGINEVLIDGVVLDESAYRVDEWKWLVRTDGNSWPCCQHIELAETEPGTFQVDFSYGHPAPRPGILAAKVLGCEFALACGGEETAELCRLPRNIIQVSRQGVSMLAKTATELFVRTPGRPIQTGLWEVDAFLAAYAPYGATARSVVLSPDIGIPEVRRVNT